MSNTNILNLPVAIALSGDEWIGPVVQGGTDKRAQVGLLDSFTQSGGLQSVNLVFAGPSSGSAAAPTFRSLVNADIAGAGAALTKADDTNVTLTLGGSASTALVNAASLTLGWTGQLAISRGGTGQATAAAGFDALSPTTTQGDLIYRNATTNTRLAAGTSGYLLQTNGAGSNPSWAGFLQSGTGAITRTWNAKVAEVASITDFGAVAGDSSSGTKTANAAAIVAAWTAAPDILIPTGTFYTDPITVPSGARSIRGYNPDTCILSGQPTAGNYLVTFNHASPFRAERLGISVAVDGIQTANGLRVQNATSGAIRDCHLSGSIALQFNSCTDFEIEDNLVTAWWQFGILGTVCTHITITDNDVRPCFDNTGGNAIEVLNGNGVVITDNVIDKPAVFGINAQAQGASLVGLVICNNRIKGNIREAIIVSTFDADVTNFIVNDNVCTFDEYGVSQDYGIDIIAASDGSFTATNGVVSNNLVRKSGKNGIEIEYAKYITISGNTIVDPGSWVGASSAEKNGIVAAGQYLNIVGNEIIDTLGNLVYAISEQSVGTNNTFSDNTGTVGSSGFYSISGSTSTAGRVATKFIQGDYLIAGSAVQVSHTGDTNKTTLATVTIPANIMGSNGFLRISAIWGFVGTAGAKTCTIEFGGTAYINSAFGATALSARSEPIIANRNATNSQVGFATGQVNFSSTTTGVTTSAVDTTANVSLIFTVQLANSGDTASLEGYLVELLSPSS